MLVHVHLRKKPTPKHNHKWPTWVWNTWFLLMVTGCGPWEDVMNTYQLLDQFASIHLSILIDWHSKTLDWPYPFFEVRPVVQGWSSPATTPLPLGASFFSFLLDDRFAFAHSRTQFWSRRRLKGKVQLLVEKQNTKTNLAFRTMGMSFLKKGSTNTKYWVSKKKIKHLLNRF